MAKLWRAPRPWTTRAVRPASSRTAIGVISALSPYSRDDPPFYVPASLQRAADVRLDERTLQAHRADPTARALLVTRGRSKSLVASQEDGASRVGTVALAALLARDEEAEQEAVFLGVQPDGAPLFAVAVEADDTELPEGARWEDLRELGPDLEHADAALLGLARSLVSWNLSVRFCGSCGERTAPRRAGYSRQCPACAARFYPRLDPAIIVLVTAGDYCLLARNKRWNAGRFSLLAGFAEVCETLEMAVVREVHEETGVGLDPASVCFIASQPWPFPSSLMMGFSANVLPPVAATAADGGPPYAAADVLPPVTPDGTEIADARWFHRSWLATAMDPAHPATLPAHFGDDAGAPFSVPGGYSIACRVLEQWVSQPLQSSTWQGPPVPDAVVSQAPGEFKYMLLEVSTADGQHSKLVVRGDARAPYHRDVIRHAERELAPLELVVAQRGGGWVRATSDGAFVLYGESSRFGAADHNVAAELLRRAHPFWSVSVTTEC